MFLLNKDIGKRNDEMNTILSSCRKMPIIHRSFKVVLRWHAQSYLSGMEFFSEPPYLQSLTGSWCLKQRYLYFEHLGFKKKSNLPWNPFCILKIVSEFSVQSEWLFGRQNVSPNHQGIFISNWDYSQIHCRLVSTIIFEFVF